MVVALKPIGIIVLPCPYGDIESLHMLSCTRYTDCAGEDEKRAGCLVLNAVKKGDRFSSRRRTEYRVPGNGKASSAKRYWPACRKNIIPGVRSSSAT